MNRDSWLVKGEGGSGDSSAMSCFSCSRPGMTDIQTAAEIVMDGRRTTSAFVVLSLLLLAGCANMENRTKCIASGAAIGAVIGAGSGLVIGNQVNKGLNDNYEQEGAWVGAAAGVLIGSVVGMIVCEADVDTDKDGVIDEKDARIFMDRTLNDRAQRTKKTGQVYLSPRKAVDRPPRGSSGLLTAYQVAERRQTLREAHPGHAELCWLALQ